MNKKGQSIVEWALILPVFLLLLFGTIDFALLLSKQHLLNQVSKEVARAASVGTSVDAIRNRAVALSQNINGASSSAASGTGTTTVTISNSGQPDVVITISPALSSRVKGQSISITTTFQYKLFTPFFSGVQVPLKSKAETLIESEPSP